MVTSHSWLGWPVAPPSSSTSLPSESSESGFQRRKGAVSRKGFAAAAWRLQRSRSTSSSTVWRAYMADSNPGREALLLPLSAMTATLVSRLRDQSLSILASSLSRWRSFRGALSMVVTTGCRSKPL